jgi:hypothetical protein
LALRRHHRVVTLAAVRTVAATIAQAITCRNAGAVGCVCSRAAQRPRIDAWAVGVAVRERHSRGYDAMSPEDERRHAQDLHIEVRRHGGRPTGTRRNFFLRDAYEVPDEV